jgi:hypothetical protein
MRIEKKWKIKTWPEQVTKKAVDWPCGIVHTYAWGWSEMSISFGSSKSIGSLLVVYSECPPLRVVALQSTGVILLPIAVFSFLHNANRADPPCILAARCAIFYFLEDVLVKKNPCFRQRIAAMFMNLLSACLWST